MMCASYARPMLPSSFSHRMDRCVKYAAALCLGLRQPSTRVPVSRNKKTSPHRLKPMNHSGAEALMTVNDDSVGIMANLLTGSEYIPVTTDADEIAASLHKLAVDIVEMGGGIRNIINAVSVLRRVVALWPEDRRPSDDDVIRQAGWIIKASDEPRTAIEASAVETKPTSDNLDVMSADELVAAHADYRPAVIDGLLREGETMNVIAAPKVGKSWLVLLMSFSVANGLPFLGRKTEQGNVLIIDNELHPETAAQRLRTVANALGVPLTGVHVVSLRGILQDLPTLRSRVERAAVGVQAKIIVLDALYRLLPSETSENDNAGMMQLYNEIDRMAKITGAAVICIHHSSKGSQGDKSVTDGGAGAGAISRAADTHLFLREHEEEGHVVVDAVARSWPPPLAMVISRNNGSVWGVVCGADPKRIKGRKVKHADELTMDELTNTYLAQYPEPVGTIYARISGNGLNVPRNKIDGMLGLAAAGGLAVVEVGRYGAKLYGREPSVGGSSTLLDKARAYILANPTATHGQVAAVVGCSLKTAQRAVCQTHTLNGSV